MRYRNKATGAILDINSELSGDSWEALTSQPTAKQQAEESKEEKKTVSRKRKG